MAKRVFFSFHYQPDNWRASQVRNFGAIEGNAPVTDNDWETVTRGGDAAIERWIAEQMKGRSCAVVLIGANTAGRKWINYEIKKAWDDGRGLVGIHIHGLKDRQQQQASKGANPFDGFTVGQRRLADIVRTYDPPYWDSKDIYSHIGENIEAWVDEAIRIRESVN